MTEAEQLKKEIEEEVQRVWVREPDEIKRLRIGIIESGAGSYGQYFSPLVISEGEARTLGALCLTTIFKVIDDPEFELSHIRKLSKMLIPVSASFLGYCGLKKLQDFNHRYLEIMEKTDSRKELKWVLDSLLVYANRMYGWIRFYFPWGLGTQFRRKTKEEIQELQRLIALG